MWGHAPNTLNCVAVVSRMSMVMGSSGVMPDLRKLQWGNLWWLLLTLLVVVLDQWSKHAIEAALRYGEVVPVLSFFNLTLAYNPGAAFSFLADAGGWQRWFFVALALAFTVFIIYELRKLPLTERIMGVVYGLILGGALGNMVDRLTNGYVVDFILFHYQGWIFPAFNVADISLFTGASLWILTMLREYLKEKKAAAE